MENIEIHSLLIKLRATAKRQERTLKETLQQIDGLENIQAALSKGKSK